MRHGHFLRSILLAVALLGAWAVAARAELQKDIQSILADELLRNASVGVAIEAMPEGRVLYRHNEHQLLMRVSMWCMRRGARRQRSSVDFKTS